MSRSLLSILTGLLLIAAACSSDSATTTTSPVTTGQGLVEASAAPPVSFSEVQAEHETSVKEISAAGVEALDLFLGDEFQALFERLDAEAAAELTVQGFAVVKEQLTLQAPLGEIIEDRAVQLSPGLRFYGARLEWGQEVATVTVGFNTEWEISGLTLNPEFANSVDPSAGYESDVSFGLPFEGLWFVFWGGSGQLRNYHVVARDQRHALDLVIWKDGGTHRGEGTVNEDYWAYGQKVIAPAAGAVVTVVDGLADNVPQVGSDRDNAAGNHVVMRVADSEYILIAHMQAGSLGVSEGDTVEQGQEIGLVGNSGDTSEPQIHIHLQDRPTFDPDATGLPLEFSSYLANGQAVEKGELSADQFVANS